MLIKHWKNNNNAWVFPYTTPSDIYSDFVGRFGRENLFPVARTEIGNIGLPDLRRARLSRRMRAAPC